MPHVLLIKAAIAISLACLPHICPTVPAIVTWAVLPLLLWGPLRPFAGEAEPTPGPRPRKPKVQQVEDDISQAASRHTLRPRPPLGPRPPRHSEALLPQPFQAAKQPPPPHHVAVDRPGHSGGPLRSEVRPMAPLPSTQLSPIRACDGSLALPNHLTMPAANAYIFQAHLPVLRLLEDVEAQGRHLLWTSYTEGVHQIQARFSEASESIQSKAGLETWTILEPLQGTPPPLRRRSTSRRNSLLLTPQRYLPYTKKMAPDTPGPVRHTDSSKLAELQMSVRFILSDAEATSRAALSSRAQTEQACLVAQLQLLQQWEASIRAVTKEQEVADLHHLAVHATAHRCSLEAQHGGPVDRLVQEMAHHAAIAQLQDSARSLHSTWGHSRAQEELLEGMTRANYRAAERQARMQLTTDQQLIRSLLESSLRERQLVEEMEKSMRQALRWRSDEMMVD